MYATHINIHFPKQIHRDLLHEMETGQGVQNKFRKKKLLNAPPPKKEF